MTAEQKSFFVALIGIASVLFISMAAGVPHLCPIGVMAVLEMTG